MRIPEDPEKDYVKGRAWEGMRERRSSCASSAILLAGGAGGFSSVYFRVSAGLVHVLAGIERRKAGPPAEAE